MLLTVVKWSRQLNPRYCKLVPFIPRTESILPNTKILGIASRGWRMNHWCAFPSVVIIGLFFLFYLRRRLLLGRQRGCLNQNLGANSIDFWWRIGLQLRRFLVISPCSRYQGTSGAAWRNCLWISGQWFHIMVKIVFLYKALAHIEIIDSRQNNRWMVVSL